MGTIEGPKTDKEWQAHDDAHTLARAKEVMADEKRLKAATEAAEKIAKNLAEEAERMKGSKDLLDKMYPKMDTDKDGK
ncbi:MAG: hypothetical protein ABSF52_09380 [Syntrophobacteraceae bacterium]|jgi:hypothetical protein